jgi:hypothetical protein
MEAVPNKSRVMVKVTDNRELRRMVEAESVNEEVAIAEDRQRDVV